MSDKGTEVVKVEPVMRSESRGVQPRTRPEIVELAEAVCKTEFCLQAFRNKPIETAIAMQYGMELGLTAMSAVRSIAVIKGKPSLYGDGLLAVCQGSGVFDFTAFQEVLSGEGDARGYTCTVSRIGGVKSETRFTIADAKRAKLWGKAGTWTDYPQRMLQMRARGFALRNCFADVLCGIISADEAEDYPPPQDSTNRIEAATAAMTLGAPDIVPIEIIDGGTVHYESATTTGPAGTATPSVGRAVDSDAEARELMEQRENLRKNILAAFKRLDGEAKLRVYDLYELHSMIANVKNWQDLGMLQSLYDSIVSES